MGTKSRNAGKKKKCQTAVGQELTPAGQELTPAGQPLTGHLIDNNAKYRAKQTGPRRSTQSDCAGCGATITFTITDEEHLIMSPVVSNTFIRQCDNCDSVHEFTIDFTTPLALSDEKSMLGLYHTRAFEFATEPWSSQGSDVSRKDLVMLFVNASSSDSVDLLLQFMFASPELLWMKDLCGNLPVHGLCSNQLLDQDTKARALCVVGRLCPPSLTQRSSILVHLGDGARGGTPLHHAARSPGNSQAVAALITMCPEALLMEGLYDGELPLHLACYITKQRWGNTIPTDELSVDIDMIRTIARAEPRALLAPQKQGLLPLHIACEQCGSAEVIRALIELEPRALEVFDDSGWLCIHRAALNSLEVVATLLKYGSADAVRMPTTKGDLLLHVACSHSTTVDVVEGLLLIHPEAVAHKNHAGETPLECCTTNSSKAALQIGQVVAAAAPQYIRCLKKQHPVWYAKLRAEEKAWNQQSSNPVLRALSVNQCATPEAQTATVDAKVRASAENLTPRLEEDGKASAKENRGASLEENKKGSEEAKVVSWKKSPVLPTSGWLEAPAVKKQWCVFQKELRAARPRKPTLEQLVAELFKSNDSSVREQIWEWIDKAATRLLPVPVKQPSFQHMHYDIDVELYAARTTHPFLGNSTGAFSLFDFPDFQESLSVKSLKNGRALAALLKGCDLALHPRIFIVVCNVLNQVDVKIFQEFTRASGMQMLVSAAAHPVFEELETSSPFGLHFLFHIFLFALNPSGARSANERTESHQTMVQSSHFDQLIQNISNYLVRAPATGLLNGTENHAIACATAREGAVVALLNYSNEGLGISKLRIGINAVRKSTLDLVFEAMVVTLCNFCHEDVKVVRDAANFFYSCSKGTLHVKAGQLCSCIRNCCKDFFYYSQEHREVIQSALAPHWPALLPAMLECCVRAASVPFDPKLVSYSHKESTLTLVVDMLEALSRCVVVLLPKEAVCSCDQTVACSVLCADIDTTGTLDNFAKQLTAEQAWFLVACAAGDLVGAVKPSAVVLQTLDSTPNGRIQLAEHGIQLSKTPEQQQHAISETEARQFLGEVNGTFTNSKMQEDSIRQHIRSNAVATPSSLVEHINVNEAARLGVIAAARVHGLAETRPPVWQSLAESSSIPVGLSSEANLSSLVKRIREEQDPVLRVAYQELHRRWSSNASADATVVLQNHEFLRKLPRLCLNEADGSHAAVGLVVGRFDVVTTAAKLTDTHGGTHCGSVISPSGSVTCANCGASPRSRKKFAACGRCKSSYYCSTVCQKEDWESHKLCCISTK